MFFSHREDNGSKVWHEVRVPHLYQVVTVEYRDQNGRLVANELGFNPDWWFLVLDNGLWLQVRGSKMELGIQFYDAKPDKSSLNLPENSGD